MQGFSGKKAKIISVANQKGGVGKTTTVINVATALAIIGQRTLIVDFDPQGNSATGLGVSYRDRGKTIYEFICNDKEFDAIKKIEGGGIERLDIIPANQNLAAAEIELSEMKNKQFVLKSKIEEISHNYDFIIIDCPPSLGMLTINAITASDSIIIPVQCEFFALEGIVHFMKTFEAIKDNFNPSIEIEGILLTMHDKRNGLTEQVEMNVREHFGELVYKTCIPRNVRVAEAPSHGKPVLTYDLKCPGSLAYIGLVKEIMMQNNIKID